MRSTDPRSPRPASLLLWLAPLALTGCLGSGGPPEMTREQKIELYTETASYLYEDGSFLRAQDQAVKALQLDPENEAMRRMIGWIRLRMGTTEDLAIAEEFFRNLRFSGDEHPATIQGLATVTEQLGVGFDLAARDFAAGTREPADGGDPAVAAREAQDQAMQYWEESADLYRSTLDEGEGSTRSKNGLQRVLSYQGKYEESLAMSEQVLGEAREELAQWRRMLTASDLTDRDEDLMRNNERAAQQLLFDTHLFAAQLRYKLGQYGAALEDIDGAALLDPGSPEVYSLRGQLRAKLDDHAGAIQDIDRYLKLSETPLEHPDVQRAFDLRASCEVALSEQELAESSAAGGSQ